MYIKTRVFGFIGSVQSINFQAIDALSRQMKSWPVKPSSWSTAAFPCEKLLRFCRFPKAQCTRLWKSSAMGLDCTFWTLWEKGDERFNIPTKPRLIWTRFLKRQEREQMRKWTGPMRMNWFARICILTRTVGNETMFTVYGYTLKTHFVSEMWQSAIFMHKAVIIAANDRYNIYFSTFALSLVFVIDSNPSMLTNLCPTISL